MYTIGQFSEIGQVSTKMLRYYDEIDLLQLIYVDKDSKYRYYSDEQVLKILFISELKEYGLKLGEAYAKVIKWIEENGYKSVGVPFDIYLTGPESTKNPEQFVTEVYFPVNR